MKQLEALRTCVCFLGFEDDKGEKIPIGTAFFIGQTFPDNPYHVFYIVTSKHLIQALKVRKIHSVWLRINRKAGGFYWLESDISLWESDPSDPSVDVAIVPCNPIKEDDISFVSLTPISQEGCGVGDEIFSIGLFAQHYGEQRNIPIIRVGNISAMPEEKIVSKIWGPIDVYLVELRSISGLSGSPVFIRSQQFIQAGAHPERMNNWDPIFHLVGLIHGHWDIAKNQLLEQADSEKHSEPLNTGIAMVVPVEKILQVLRTPIMVKYQKEKTAWLKKNDPDQWKRVAPGGP